MNTREIRRTVFLAWLIDVKLQKQVNSDLSSLHVKWIRVEERDFTTSYSYDGNEQIHLDQEAEVLFDTKSDEPLCPRAIEACNLFIGNGYEKGGWLYCTAGRCASVHYFGIHTIK